MFLCVLFTALHLQAHYHKCLSDSTSDPLGASYVPDSFGLNISLMYPTVVNLPLLIKFLFVAI